MQQLYAGMGRLAGKYVGPGKGAKHVRSDR